MPRAMRVDRFLGEHGIGQNSAAGRQEFERQMKRHRLEAIDEEAPKPRRRSWQESELATRRRSDPSKLRHRCPAAERNDPADQVDCGAGADRHGQRGQVRAPSSGSEPRPTQNRKRPRTLRPARILSFSFPGSQSRRRPETHRRGQPLQSEARNAKNAPESAICGVLPDRPAPTGSVLWLVPISNPRNAPRRVGRTNLRLADRLLLILLGSAHRVVWPKLFVRGGLK
jgi:hypothetical protein